VRSKRAIGAQNEPERVGQTKPSWLSQASCMEGAVMLPIA